MPHPFIYVDSPKYCYISSVTFLNIPFRDFGISLSKFRKSKLWNWNHLQRIGNPCYGYHQWNNLQVTLFSQKTFFKLEEFEIFVIYHKCTINNLGKVKHFFHLISRIFFFFQALCSIGFWRIPTTNVSKYVWTFATFSESQRWRWRLST